jgi:hypothetical protein
MILNTLEETNLWKTAYRESMRLIPSAADRAYSKEEVNAWQAFFEGCADGAVLALRERVKPAVPADPGRSR